MSQEVEARASLACVSPSPTRTEPGRDVDGGSPVGSVARRGTTVICVRGRDPAALRADPRFVYVGRAVRRGGGWPGSMWYNPYTAAGCGGAAEAVRRFEREIRDHSGRAVFLRSLLGELRGKVLGCWCCDWDGQGKPSTPCHAVVLARMADECADRNAPRRP